MPSERVQRQIDRLLDEAEEAIVRRDWSTVRDRAESVLALDPDNADAIEYRKAAERAGAPSGSELEATKPGTSRAPSAPPLPTSFAAGRYVVRKFLGEGGKKKVY